jgi:hypothetical protein
MAMPSPGLVVVTQISTIYARLCVTGIPVTPRMIHFEKLVMLLPPEVTDTGVDYGVFVSM